MGEQSPDSKGLDLRNREKPRELQLVDKEAQRCQELDHTSPYRAQTSDGKPFSTFSDTNSALKHMCHRFPTTGVLDIDVKD